MKRDIALLKSFDTVLSNTMTQKNITFPPKKKKVLHKLGAQKIIIHTEAKENHRMVKILRQMQVWRERQLCHKRVKDAWTIL